MHKFYRTAKKIFYYYHQDEIKFFLFVKEKTLHFNYKVRIFFLGCLLKVQKCFLKYSYFG